MEADFWLDLDDDADTCLSRQDCIDDLLRDAPEGCVYCRLAQLSEEDED
jgi:hypothetical protein